MKRYSSLWLVVLLAVLGCEPALPPLADGPDMDSQQAEIELVTQTRQLEPISVQLGSAELLAGIPGDGPLTTEELEAWLAAPSQHAPLDFTFPMWLTPGAGQAKDLSEEPLTRAKIELGRQLFFDPRLSADKTISCASCHEPEKGYSVSTPFASGVGGQVGKRNPPTLLNRVMLALGDDRQFWDGRSASVEEALLHALHDPTEMAADPQETVAKLKGIDGYQLQFERIYGEVSWDAIGDAVGGASAASLRALRPTTTNDAGKSISRWIPSISRMIRNWRAGMRRRKLPQRHILCPNTPNGANTCSSGTRHPAVLATVE